MSRRCYQLLARLLFLTLVLLADRRIFADDWPAPQIITRFSESGEYFIRIYPGKSWGDSFGFAGAAKGPYAKAEFFRKQADKSYQLAWERNLVNPVSPVDVLVTNSGAIFTLDNWHNTGYGKIVALYTSQGALLRSYELKDLYPEDRISKIDHSVSSRHWRKGAFGFVDPAAQTKIYVSDCFLNTFVFEVQTGRYVYELNPAKKQPDQYCELQASVAPEAGRL